MSWKIQCWKIDSCKFQSRKTDQVICAGVLLSSLLALPMAANAADMTAPAPVYKAPPVAPSPPFSWTGFYIGANVGAGWSQGTVTDSLFGISFTNQSNNAVFIGGGQIGGNYQVNNFVFGVEADFDWAGNNNNVGGGGVIGGDTFQVTANNRWITTVAGRVGIAADRWLFYVKGGGGWVGNSGFTVTNETTGGSVAFNGTSNSGWLLGGGVEWAFTNNWSVRAEYDYLGLNNQSFAVPAAVPVIGGDTFALHDRNVEMFTVGLNYRFNWAGNTVAASY